MSQTSKDIRVAWEKEHMDRVVVTVKKDVKARWKAEAEKRGLKVGRMVTLAVEEWLKKN